MLYNIWLVWRTVLSAYYIIDLNNLEIKDWRVNYICFLIPKLSVGPNNSTESNLNYNEKKFYSTSTIMWFLGIYYVGIKDAKNHHLPIQLASWHSKKKCVHCSLFTFVELQASFPFVDFWLQITIVSDSSRMEF